MQVNPPPLAGATNPRKKRCFVTTSIQNRQKTLQITGFCANCVQKKHPKTTPKSTPQPPNFDECFGKSIQRVFSQLSFFNSLFDRFLRKSPCYGAILGWRFKKKQTQKKTQKCTPETSQARGESDKNQFQKSTQIVQPTIQRGTPEPSQERWGERRFWFQKSTN